MQQYIESSCIYQKMFQYGSKRVAKEWNILEHVRVENRNPSIESTSLIHLLLHNSHHMFLIFYLHRNRSRLAVFADVQFPKNTHTHTKKQRQSECQSNSNMDSFPFAASTMEPNIKRFKVEVIFSCFSKQVTVNMLNL